MRDPTIDAWRDVLQTITALLTATLGGFWLGLQYAGSVAFDATKPETGNELILTNESVKTGGTEWVVQVADMSTMVAVACLLAGLAWIYFDYTGEDND